MTAFGGTNYGDVDDNPFDTGDYIENRVDVEDAPILCPFNTNLTCDQGCQVCDSPSGDGTYVAQCCGYTDTCQYTSRCEIPCQASSQFQGEGVGCMFCAGEGLKACTATTAPCTFSNRCTANTKKKYERPEDQAEYNRGDERDIVVAPIVPPENESLGAVANFYRDQHRQPKMTFAQHQQYMQRMVRDQQLAMHQAARFHAKQTFW